MGSLFIQNSKEMDAEVKASISTKLRSQHVLGTKGQTASSVFIENDSSLFHPLVVLSKGSTSGGIVEPFSSGYKQ